MKGLLVNFSSDISKQGEKAYDRTSVNIKCVQTVHNICRTGVHLFMTVVDNTVHTVSI